MEKQAKSFEPVIFPHNHFRRDPVLMREFLFPVQKQTTVSFYRLLHAEVCFDGLSSDASKRLEAFGVASKLIQKDSH